MVWKFKSALPRGTIPGFVEAGRYVLPGAFPTISPHVHPAGRLEVCLVEHGQHRDTVNDRPYLVHKGQALVVRPNDRHGDIDVAQEPVTISFLILDVSAAGIVFLGFRAAEARRIRKDLLAVKNPCFSCLPLAITLWQAVAATIQCQSDPEAAEQDSIVCDLRAYLSAFVAALIESSRLHEGTRPVPLSTRVNSLLDRQLDQQLSIATLACALNMSESYFMARFKKETGLSPTNYMLRRKIEAAKARLTKSNESVTRIALDLGFSSSQNFSTAFRRVAGQTPTHYRFWHRRQPSAAG